MSSGGSIGRTQHVVANVPVAATVFLAMFAGVAVGIYVFPIPPYSNVGPAASVMLLSIAVAAFGTLEVKAYYAAE